MENPPVNDNNDANGAKLTAAVAKNLERILKEQGARENCNYEIEEATAKGDNYLGVVYRITADAENDQNEKINCIVKVPPSNPARRKQFFSSAAFLREAMAYMQFIPLVEKFQTERGIVDPKLRFHEYPKCFGAMTDTFDEAIFMENMNLKGYKLFDRFKEIDIEHVALVMRAYGKLHALSFALKELKPYEFETFQVIVDIFEQRKDDQQLIGYFEHLKTTALKSLDAENDKHYYEKLQQYFDKDKFMSLFLPLLQADDCEQYAVVGHGDCWNNNFLFKYEQNNVVDVCVIDWQLMRYASPVVDLMYFMFCSTTKEFREKHYGEAIDIYYEELAAHLKRLGFNAEKLFPRDAFENQLKLKGAVGLLMASIVLPVVTMKTEDVPDLEKLSEKLEAGDVRNLDTSGFTSGGKLLEKRMRDVIIDCIDYGYIV